VSSAHSPTTTGGAIFTITSRQGRLEARESPNPTKGRTVNTKRTVATGLAALAAVAALGACSNTATKEASTTSAPSSAQTSSQAQVAAHNEADMMFARMMIPHHEQAIEMSDMMLEKQGIDPRVMDLVTQIEAAQGPEIEKMQGWLNQWGMSDMPGHGGDMPGHGGMKDSDTAGMPGMDGMMSPAQMDALDNATGVEASRLFLTGMIKHHEGAITMAQDEIKNGQFPEAVALAKSILESQQKEIDTMRTLVSQQLG
jgi:uncharacterized protein (DUF305 family)